MTKKFIEKRNSLVFKKIKLPLTGMIAFTSLISVISGNLDGFAVMSALTVISFHFVCTMTSAKYHAIIPTDKKELIKSEYKFNFILMLLACLSTFFIGVIAQFFHANVNISVLAINVVVCYCVSAVIPIVVLPYTYSFTKFRAKIFELLYFAIVVPVWLIFWGFVILFFAGFIYSAFTAQSFNEFSENFAKNPSFVLEPLINQMIEKVKPFFENLLSYFHDVPLLMIVFILTVTLHIVSYISAIRNCKCYNKNFFSLWFSKP